MDSGIVSNSALSEDQAEKVINVREFLDTRLALVREDYFERHKNIREKVANDLQLPEVAMQRLEEMCR